jgi:tetratricopeptide (TPR) repeat protein
MGRYLRRSRSYRAVAVLGFVISLLASPVASADPDPAKLEQAKALFREGVETLAAGNAERALDLFLRSRALVPSGKNIANAAICLEQLGRYDEALELYEEIVARFAADLDPRDRENLAPVMASLGSKIGYLELSANVDGFVVAGDRPRGSLPFGSALRLLPGTQSIRITAAGYRPLTVTVEVRAGETQRLVADLEPVPSKPTVDVTTPTRAAPARDRHWETPVLISGGALAALGVGTILVSSQLLSDKRVDLAQNCLTRSGDDCFDARQSQRDAAQSDANAIVTLKAVRAVGYGAAALGFGAVSVGLYRVLFVRAAKLTHQTPMAFVSATQVSFGWAAEF